MDGWDGSDPVKNTHPMVFTFLIRYIGQGIHLSHQYFNQWEVAMST